MEITERKYFFEYLAELRYLELTLSQLLWCNMGKEDDSTEEIRKKIYEWKNQSNLKFTFENGSVT